MYKEDEQKLDRSEAKQFDGMTIETLSVEGRASEDYVPEGFESKELFLQDMRENFEADVDFDRENREAALEDKKFAAGEQWDPIVLEQRQGLPCLVINNIPQFTAQLVGDWRESRKAVKVVPSTDEDTDVASVRGDLIRNIEMASRADRVYDSAFESLVQCGDGAFRVAVEYARDDVFDQDLFIRPIEDALSVVWTGSLWTRLAETPSTSLLATVSRRRSTNGSTGTSIPRLSKTVTFTQPTGATMSPIRLPSTGVLFSVSVWSASSPTGRCLN